MSSVEFNRRLFHWVLWVFTGLCLLILLTSCVEIDQYIQPVATADQKWRAPSAVPSTPAAVSTETASPTPLPSYLVASDALEIRTGPREAAKNIGYLARGAIVTVYQTAQAENEYCPAWAKISPARERWVCFKYLTIGE